MKSQKFCGIHRNSVAQSMTTVRNAEQMCSPDH